MTWHCNRCKWKTVLNIENSGCLSARIPPQKIQMVSPFSDTFVHVPPQKIQMVSPLPDTNTPSKDLNGLPLPGNVDLISWIPYLDHGILYIDTFMIYYRRKNTTISIEWKFKCQSAVLIYYLMTDFPPQLPKETYDNCMT